MSIFTPDEELYLHRTRQIRQDLIQQMTKGGMPEQNKDIRLLMELCDSADNHVLTTAKLRIDDKSSQQNNNIAAMISGLLEKVGQQPKVISGVQTIHRELPNDTTFTFTEGEMDDSKAIVCYEDVVR
jgi:hypothetical protein